MISSRGAKSFIVYLLLLLVRYGEVSHSNTNIKLGVGVVSKENYWVAQKECAPSFNSQQNVAFCIILLYCVCVLCVYIPIGCVYVLENAIIC